MALSHDWETCTMLTWTVLGKASNLCISPVPAPVLLIAPMIGPNWGKWGQLSVNVFCRLAAPKVHIVVVDLHRQPSRPIHKYLFFFRNYPICWFFFNEVYLLLCHTICQWSEGPVLGSGINWVQWTLVFESWLLQCWKLMLPVVDASGDGSSEIAFSLQIAFYLLPRARCRTLQIGFYLRWREEMGCIAQFVGRPPSFWPLLLLLLLLLLAKYDKQLTWLGALMLPKLANKNIFLKKRKPWHSLIHREPPSFLNWVSKAQAMGLCVASNFEVFFRF